MKPGKEKKGASGEKSNIKELSPRPSYIEDRLQIWDKLKAKYLAELAAKPKNHINITLPDGKVVEGTSWNTTAYDIAKSIRYVSNTYKAYTGTSHLTV